MYSLLLFVHRNLFEKIEGELCLKLMANIYPTLLSACFAYHTDVDTPEPDEKSLITYISSLYDVFPNPPALHPLYDPEMQRKYSEYRELSSSLHVWIRESMAVMQDRNFPNTLIEVKKLAHESNRFRTEEVPHRQREKQHIIRLYKDVEVIISEGGSLIHSILSVVSSSRYFVAI